MAKGRIIRISKKKFRDDFDLYITSASLGDVVEVEVGGRLVVILQKKEEQGEPRQEEEDEV